MVNNADFYYQHFRGDLGGSTLNKGAPAADIKTNNTFSFKKAWAAELNASFNSGGRDGYMVSRPQWALSSGIQKTILKSKGTLRFNVTDIFWTNLPKAVITYPGKYIETMACFPGKPRWYTYHLLTGLVRTQYKAQEKELRDRKKRGNGRNKRPSYVHSFTISYSSFLLMQPFQ